MRLLAGTRDDIIGQYVLYRDLLEETEPQRTLYLAVDDEVHKSVFQRVGFQVIVKKNNMRMLVVRVDREEIVQWIG